MTQSKKLSVKIPFSGFYESIHDAEIDREIESYFDTEGDGDNHIPENFYYSFNHHGDIQREYAKVYAENFADWFEGETGLKLPLTYEDLQSPREYNFATDRIFAAVPLSALKKIRAYVTDKTLGEHIKDSFTSYDGFMSYYSNDLADWKAKPLATWDHNELGTLIEAALIQCGAAKNGCNEYDLMDHPRCNGVIGNIVCPYLDAWVKKNPIDATEDKIKVAFDLPDSMWEDLNDDEKEEYLEQFNAIPVRCDKTPDLFRAQG
jgi:hypothetical protein